MISPSRRQLITGLVSLVAAPAIVRASSLMPVKAINADLLDRASLRLSNPIIYLSTPSGDHSWMKQRFFALTDGRGKFDIGESFIFDVERGAW